MPPISPYMPEGEQNQIASNPQATIHINTTQQGGQGTAQSFSSQNSPSSDDFDWVVRFCYVACLAPQIGGIIRNVFDSIIHTTIVPLQIFLNGRHLLNISSAIFIQVFVFWLLLLFVRSSQDYKKVLIVFVVASQLAMYTNTNVSLWIMTKSSKTIQSCTTYTTCNGTTPGSSCFTSCGDMQYPSSVLK